MGQKVNPIGFRVGVNKNWDSVWFIDKKNYAKALHEDLKIKKIVMDFNYSNDDGKKGKKIAAEISKVEIYRKPDRLTVYINSSRPGIVIGQEGKNIQELTKLISKVTSAKIDIKIKDLKKPESNAMLIAQNIAKQIAARIPFRRAMKKAISDAKKGGVSGIKIQCAGRLGGADMARTEWYREGRIPLQTLRADIDYAYTVANTTYGIIGIKVWVFSKEILKKDVKEDAGQLVKKQKKIAGKKGDE